MQSIKKSIKKIMPSSLIMIYRNIVSRYQKIRLLKFGKYILTTSLSDNQIYPDFCIKASLDVKVFSRFRRNYIYNNILEHVSEEEGLEYLAEIKNSNKDLLGSIELFKQNDKYGNPRIFEYNGIGEISPTTLRYIKVLSDLVHFFKKLDNLKICEIGAGYGGQCRIINCVAFPSEYTLVDIKPALMLAQCFLDKFILSSVMSFKTMNELEHREYDLVISNYAFSELPRNVQDVYLNRVILNSKRGYITYGEITPPYFNSYKKKELLAAIPNSHIIEEKPLTNENNYIIVWGD